MYSYTENIRYFQWSQIFSSIEVLNLTIAAALPNTHGSLGQALTVLQLVQIRLCLRRDSGEYFPHPRLVCTCFTHLVVTTKPFLSAAALTWISTLLKFSWLKRPNPIFISYLLMQLTPLLEKEACVGPDDPPMQSQRRHS